MPDPGSPTKAREDARRRIEALWARGLPQIRDRLELLERAAAEMALGRIDAALAGEAMETAHKWAGSLGMFGFAEGTRLARELEVELETGAPDATKVQALVSGLRAVLFPGSPMNGDGC